VFYFCLLIDNSINEKIIAEFLFFMVHLKEGG